MHKKLKGGGVALVTPFHKDGGIDFKALEKLVSRLIENKVDYLVSLGTTGESSTLTKGERLAMFDLVAEVNEKRLPLVLGLGGNNTQEIINCMKENNFDNVDAILSVCPYYNKPTQKGIYQHYKFIASVAPVPVIIYNIPSRTGVNITDETILSLANDINNIIGVKEASGNFEQCMQIIKNKPKDFLFISGDDNYTLPLLALGGDGVISVIANAFPKDFMQLVKNALEGNMDKARKYHYKLFELMQLLFVEGNPAGIKAMLDVLGICQPFVRLPLVNVSRSIYNKIEMEVKACG